MSVHYKFKNTINYDAVKFDGVYISASDLKSIIVQQKKMNHSELQVENEETGQLYSDDQMIPKNTNIIVSRLPFANTNKRTRLAANQPYPARFSGNNNSGSLTNNNNGNNLNSNNYSHHHHHNHHNNYRHQSTVNSSTSSNNHNNHHSSATTSNGSSIGNGLGSISEGGGREAMELVSTKNMSEEEKIKYIQSQSTKDFDPTRYARSNRGGGPGGRGMNRPHGTPGPGYTCRKCGIPGHLIYDCKSSTMHKVKRSSGIPRDFLMPVDSKEKGALMTPDGGYAVPYIDREAYNNPKIEKAPFFEDGTPSDDLDETSSKSASTATSKSAAKTEIVTQSK